MGLNESGIISILRALRDQLIESLVEVQKALNELEEKDG